MRTLTIAAMLATLVGCGPAPKPEAKVETKAPAPEKYRVKFDTSKGVFVVAVTRSLAPIGADRFHELVQDKFYDEARFFRVLKHFVVQFGINKDPSVTALWNHLNLVDDPVKESNKRGTISFATGGPNTRTTEVFVNLADNASLDGRGFAAFGEVAVGMDVVDSLYSGYGEGEPQGEGPDQTKIETQGNEYLINHFSRLDHIKTARVE